MKNCCSLWLSDLCKTSYHEIRKSIILPLCIWLTVREGSLASVWSSGPRKNLPTWHSSICKFRTFLAVSVYIIKELLWANSYMVLAMKWLKCFLCIIVFNNVGGASISTKLFPGMYLSYQQAYNWLESWRFERKPFVGTNGEGLALETSAFESLYGG